MANLREIEERGARWANIIAAIPGSYCAYVLWTQRHGGTAIPMNAAFTFAVVMFLTCLGVGAVLNVLRKQKPPSEERVTQPSIPYNLPPWGDAANEQDYKKSVAEQNRLIELGRSIDGIFTPLQIDALALWKDLQGFLASESERAKSKLTGDEASNALEWTLSRYSPDPELMAKYELQIEDRAVKIYNRFVVAGVIRPEFRTLALLGNSCGVVFDMAALLWQMTGEIGKFDDDKA